MLERLFNEVYDIQLIGINEVYSTVILSRLRANHNKVIGLQKVLANMTITNPLEYEDSIGELAIVLLETFQELDYSEEEFTSLITEMFEDGTREASESKSLYNLIKTKCKSRLSEINGYKKKIDGERIHKTEFSSRHIEDLPREDGMTSIDALEARTFNNNDLFIEKRRQMEIELWLKDNKKKSLSYNERSYLKNPLSIASSMRTRRQGTITDKLQKLAMVDLGTNNGKVAEAILKKRIIESIICEFEVGGNIEKNYEFITELSGYYDLSFEILKDINKSISEKSHRAKDSSVVAICSLLWKELDKQQAIIDAYKEDENDTKVKEAVAKPAFKITEVPNININSVNYPRCVKTVENNDYKKFKLMHKKQYENENIAIDSKWYIWDEYARWCESHQVDKNTSYYITFLGKEDYYSENNCLMLPREMSNLLKKTIPQTQSGKMVAKVKFRNKTYQLGSNKSVEELQLLIDEYKNKLLIELLEEYRGILSVEAFNTLSSYKFDMR